MVADALRKIVCWVFKEQRVPGRNGSLEGGPSAGGLTAGQCGVDQLTATSFQFKQFNENGVLAGHHLHLVVSPDAIGVLKWVNGFKSFTTSLMRSDGRTRAIWQPGFYDRLLRSDEEFATTVGYVLANPARASLGRWRWVATWEGPEATEA